MASRGALIAHLAVSDLQVSLGGRPVLAGLDLTVESGTVCAVVGESGSGKTSLLRSVAGFIEPDRGLIQIDGVDQAGLSPQRRHATLLFQEPRLFPALTVSENVSFALRVAGASRDERAEQARLLLARVGLEDRGADSIDGLSGGEQQRVALARAICGTPNLLLLDEPFSAVDAPRRRALRSLVADIQSELGATMIFVTHDVGDAVALADTVAVLVDGRVAQHGLVNECLASPVSAAVAALLGVE